MDLPSRILRVNTLSLLHLCAEQYRRLLYIDGYLTTGPGQPSPRQSDDLVTGRGVRPIGFLAGCMRHFESSDAP